MMENGEKKMKFYGLIHVCYPRGSKEQFVSQITLAEYVQGSSTLHNQVGL